MSDRANVWWANVCRATNHRATVQSSYCPIGLLSCRVTVSRTTIPPANVQSGFCPLGDYPVLRIARNSVETVPFHKSSTSGN